MKKRAVAILLTAAMVMSLAACGGSGNTATDTGKEAASTSTETTKTEEKKEETKTETASNDTAAEEAPAEAGEYNLEKLYIIVDGTLTATVDNGQKEFEEQWEEKVGAKLGHPIDLIIEQPEHSGYQGTVSQILATRSVGDDDYPDAMIMSASMFREYSTTGLLWDMADAYNNADFISRLRFNNNEGLKDSQGRLFGVAPTRGNGCVTYVKQTWLDAVGMKLEDIKTYDDYYAMLKAFTDQDPDGNGKAGTYGVIAAGYANIGEAPYINYTAEFWQGAYPAIYQKNGQWIDGFQEQATIDALGRLHQAYEDGVIDPDTEEASTKIAREKFWSNDQSAASGVFTYWAGTWYKTISDNMVKQGIMAEGDQMKELVQLPPIKEIMDTWGGYIDREAPVWVITDDMDGDNSREQAIFDALIETMLDGDEVMTLWVYGAEDVHWSTKAESFETVTGEEKTVTEYSYEDGQFHLRPSPNDPNAIWKKNHLDPILTIVPLSNGFSDTDPVVQAGNEFFNKYAVPAPAGAASEKLTEIQSELTDAKKIAINAAVTGEMTPEDAIQEYIDNWGDAVAEVLEELNAQ